MSIHELAAELVNWKSFLLVLGVFGFAPGAVLRLVVLAYRSGDPRRKELVAELYAVPRPMRPIWVAEQVETAIAEGLLPRVVRALSALVEHLVHVPFRMILSSRMRAARRIVADEPRVYRVPSDLLKSRVSVGDLVRIGVTGSKMRVVGIRMEVIAVKGDRLIGRALVDDSRYWARVSFRRDDLVGGIKWGWRQSQDSSST